MDNLENMNQWERKLCLQATEKSVPINAALELTPLCNLNCKMCFVRLTPEEMHCQGRMLTVEEWIDIAKQMRQMGTVYVLLTGGEPLLYPDFEKLYLSLKELGMIITINTNGTLVDEKWAVFFQKHQPRRICITLYGADRQTYADLCGNGENYDKAIQGIQLLKDRGVPVKINGSITSQNANDTERIIEIAKRFSVPYKLDTYMYPAQRERNKSFDQTARLSPEDAARKRVLIMRESQNEQAFINTAFKVANIVQRTLPGRLEKGRIKCRAGRSSFSINWQGYMRFCLMLSEPSIPIMDDGFEEAWKKLTEIVQGIRTSEYCSNCRLRDICSVCAASALLETGSYDGVPEYMCRYTRETYRQLAGFCMHEMQRRRRVGEEAEDGKG